MAARHDIKIRIQSTTDEFELSHWVSYAIDHSIESPTDTFSFAIPNHDGINAARINPLDKVTLHVDGILQMTGYIDAIAGRTDVTGGSVLDLTGRGVFGQLVDSNPTPRTLHNKTIETITLELSDPYVTEWALGNEENRLRLLQDAKGVADTQSTRGTPDTLANYRNATKAKKAAASAAIKQLSAATVFRKVKIEPGETAYEVIRRLAQKAGLAVWQSADGKGIIAKPSYDQDPLYSLQLHPKSSADREGNNVIAADVQRDHTQRYSNYTGYSNGGTGGLRNKTIVFDTGVAIDRQRVIVTDAKTLAQTSAATNREKQLGAYQSLHARYTVRGHSQGGALWQVDTICNVDDRINNLDGQYYIAGRRFAGTMSEGQRTTLTLRNRSEVLP